MNEVTSTSAIRRNSRHGLVCFFLYLAVYAAFVAGCVFVPAVMKREIVGVNLAVACGFGLIGLAFALALVYMALSRD